MALKSKTPEKEEFNVPMTLSVSTQPLYVKVIIPMAFPAAKPIIQVLARVTHKDIDNNSKIYTGVCLQSWGTHSNLLNIMRTVHQDFERDPPLPEGQ